MIEGSSAKKVVNRSVKVSKYSCYCESRHRHCVLDYHWTLDTASGSKMDVDVTSGFFVIQSFITHSITTFHASNGIIGKIEIEETTYLVEL